jgi:hypothetical protein
MAAEPDAYEYAEDEKVDCKKLDIDYKDIWIWERGQIIKVTETHYYINFEREIHEYDRKILKDEAHTEIAPLGTHTQDHEWREKGSFEGQPMFVDYFHEEYGWCQCKVLMFLEN